MEINRLFLWLVRNIACDVGVKCLNNEINLMQSIFRALY